MTVYRHFQQKDKICTMIKHYICAKAFSLDNFVGVLVICGTLTNKYMVSKRNR